MPTMSEALKEAYASAPSQVVVLHTLELRHPNFLDDNNQPTAIRVVRDHADLTATLEAGAPLNGGQAVTFLALAFDLKLPEQQDKGGIPEFVVSIDNASREIMPWLDKAVLSLVPITLTYRCYLSNDTSAPHMDPVTASLRGIEATPMRVTARASFPDLANKRFPGFDYTAADFPALAVP